MSLLVKTLEESLPKNYSFSVTLQESQHLSQDSSCNCPYLIHVT